MHNDNSESVIVHHKSIKDFKLVDEDLEKFFESVPRELSITGKNHHLGKLIEDATFKHDECVNSNVQIRTIIGSILNPRGIYSEERVRQQHSFDQKFLSIRQIMKFISDDLE
jgi:hypothetical protein